ncbi:zinc finger protein 148 [Hydra vulgaris]|uniref:zinc finger protein 148 n=1 Tax=Hydra vulgaris TaxID=6087 RepID=UPI001F5F5BDF|nr:zinc finger protein 148 [Hydra vulgaris]
MAAEFIFHKGSPTYLHPENAVNDVMSISQFMAQNLRQSQPIPPPPKHTFDISEGESVEIEKIVAAEKKDGLLYYKVKWVKYTWEAEESIHHLPHLIDGYWREHFYQNINQTALETSIGLVNENDFSRNKSVVVERDQQNKAATGAHLIGDKIIITTDNRVLSNPNAVVSDHHDVIMEFTLPGAKPMDHSYQQQIDDPSPKKQRRSYPLERKYLCTVCNKAFDRNTSLTRHLLTHTREKPFKCQLCDKAFSQNAHLKRHILIHIGQKSYQCNKCGKMFIEKGGLARHEATHSTEKPWVCNQCGKAFVLNEYLQRHLFLHTGQKPYQCNECGRLFADGSSWRAHKLTHNKEKKYKCPICSKMLKCKRNFKKHVAAHEEDKELKHVCDVCDQRFPNKKLLKQHNKKNRKHHRCTVCRKPLKTADKFVAHMATHDPNSETYNPNLVKLDPEEEEDEKDDEEDDADDKSDDEDKSDEDCFQNDSIKVGQTDEEDSIKSGLSGQDNALAFTALIIKPDHLESMASLSNSNNSSLQISTTANLANSSVIRQLSSSSLGLKSPLPTSLASASQISSSINVLHDVPGSSQLHHSLPNINKVNDLMSAEHDIKTSLPNVDLRVLSPELQAGMFISSDIQPLDMTSQIQNIKHMKPSFSNAQIVSHLCNVDINQIGTSQIPNVQILSNSSQMTVDKLMSSSIRTASLSNSLYSGHIDSNEPVSVFMSNVSSDNKSLIDNTSLVHTQTNDTVVSDTVLMLTQDNGVGILPQVLPR